MTLEDYFRYCYSGGDWREGNAIDHCIRHEIRRGEVQICIHPQGVNGETVDFVVRGNQLIELNDAFPPVPNA